jgi:hypothetical protein
MALRLAPNIMLLVPVLWFLLAGAPSISLHAVSPVLDAFKSGTEGYGCYRIPVLMRLPDGNIALYAEGRKLNCNDQGGIVDVVFKVSTDNGHTFGPLRVLYGESTNTTRVTIGNPAPVVVGGRVLMLCVRNAERLLMLRSEDAAGLVWPKVATDITDATFGKADPNAPTSCYTGAINRGGDLPGPGATKPGVPSVNMTRAAAAAFCHTNADCVGYTAETGAGGCAASGRLSKVYFKTHGGLNGDANWSSWVKAQPPTHILTGPPAGLVLPSGRILVEYYSMGPTYAGVLISDDHGKSFHPSQNNLTAGGEGTIALAPNGSVLLNSRGPNSTRYRRLR